MSGTRSHSQKAPATDALIVAHGQPSNPGPAEDALAALTAKVQACLPDMRLGSATMANGDHLEHMLTGLPEDGMIYPLFMANGWFVQTALRNRLGKSPYSVLTPLGLEPALPAIACRLVQDAASAHKMTAEAASIMIAAHGSARGQAAAESANAFATALRGLLPEFTIQTAFVEQTPHLIDVSQTMAAPCLCLPFFAMDGDHMKDDVRQELTNADFAGPILPALGQTPEIPELIAAALRASRHEREAA